VLATKPFDLGATPAAIMTAALVNSDEQSASSAVTPTRVPAWKKLGLKLKLANEKSYQSTQLENHPSSNRKRPHAGDASKASQTTEFEYGLRKRPRSGSPKPRPLKANTPNDKVLSPSLKRESNGVKKTVSFTTDTKVEDGDSSKTLIADWEAQYDQPSAPAKIRNDPEPSKKKVLKSKKSKVCLSTKKGHAALEYLTQFCESRKTWRFRKNREVWILKHLFSIDQIPADYDISLYKYLQGLNSASTRSRIRQEAEEIVRQDRKEQLDYTISIDIDSGGAKFDKVPADMENPERRRAYYEDSVRRYKRRLEQHLDEAAGEELNWVSPERLAKRRRAEITLWAIDVNSSSIESTQSSETTTSVRSSSLNGSSTQGAKIKMKKRKNRTTIIDLSSSSSSSEEESSDSGSGSDCESHSTSNTVGTRTTIGTQSSTSLRSQQRLSGSRDIETSTTRSSSTSSSGSSDEESVSDTKGGGSAVAAAAVTRGRSKSIISISS
jgi:1,2-phenylacetyl-CoA epoxidase PaaB subunit